MGTLTASMFMTVDGFTEKPDGTLISPAWSGDLQVHWSGANAHEGQMLLYGRRAFEINAGIWPSAAEDATNPDDYRAFAETMNALPKAVVSDSLQEVGWNTTVEAGPLDQVVDRLKERFDGEIVAVGGFAAWCRPWWRVDSPTGSTSSSCLTSPAPASSIFDDQPGMRRAELPLELVSNQTMDTGAIIVEYAVRR